jgi:uncharacterized protein (DUF697 family)
VEAPLSPGGVVWLRRELRSPLGDLRPLAVDGILADVLRKELVRGGGDSAVRVGGPEGAAAYVRVVGDEPSADDEAAIRRARRARVPVVVVSGSDRRLSLVPATDVVRLPRGAGFPVDEIAAALARRLGEHAVGLAARLPVLRPAVTRQLIRLFARKNGIVGAAVFVRGVDLPVLTLGQVRLMLRIAYVYGAQVGSERLPELAATVAAAFGFRAFARRALELAPLPGWAVKGAVAYAGTRTVGEAAILRFGAAEPPGEAGESAMRRPGAASPVAS